MHAGPLNCARLAAAGPPRLNSLLAVGSSVRCRVAVSRTWPGATAERQAHVRYKPVSAEDILGPLEDIDVDPKVKDAIVKAFLVFSKQQQEQGQQRQQAQEQGQQLSTRIDDLNRNVSQRMSDLREDANKVEQRFDKRFDQVDQRFKEVEQRFKEVEQRFDKRFDKLDNRFAELDKVLGRGLNVLYVLLVGFGSMAIKDVLPLISKLLP